MQTSGIGQKALYFGFLVNPKMSSVCVYHYLKRNGTEWNETERNQIGLELKNRLLNFHATLITNNLLNQWLSMTKMQNSALKHRTKSIVFLASLPIQRCPLSFYIIICNRPERNGTAMTNFLLKGIACRDIGQKQGILKGEVSLYH